MDADKRVRRWVARHARTAPELMQGTLGTEVGTRNWHYRACPELVADVVDMRESWYSEQTYEGWKIEALVSCPHGQVETSHGVVPLIPVPATLSVRDLDDIFEERDGHEEHTPS